MKAKIKAIEKTGDVLRKMPMNNPKVRRAAKENPGKPWWEDYEWQVWNNEGFKATRKNLHLPIRQVCSIAGMVNGTWMFVSLYEEPRPPEGVAQWRKASPQSV